MKVGPIVISELFKNDEDLYEKVVSEQGDKDKLLIQDHPYLKLFKI